MRPADLHAAVTQRIIADLKSGTPTWHRPWATAGGLGRPLRHGGEPYQGINILLLWSSALERGYVSPYWMTYRQAATLGGQVRRGEKASHVFFAKSVRRRGDADAADVPAGDGEDRVLHVRRAYAVFNADQVDDLPDRYRVEAPRVNTGERIAAAEGWFAGLGIDLRHGGDRAFYAPDGDYIRMPAFAAFHSPESYYACLGHEAVHWSGAKHRLDRELHRRDRESVAREELVAELGAAFLCADLGISPELRADHAPYIASWLEVLQNDAHAVTAAATRAQRAVEYLVALHGERTAEAA